MSTTPNTPANAGKAIPQWIEYACRDAVTAIVDNATSHHTWSQADALPIMMELATKLIERDRAERDAQIAPVVEELERLMHSKHELSERALDVRHAEITSLKVKLAEREAELAEKCNRLDDAITIYQKELFAHGSTIKKLAEQSAALALLQRICDMQASNHGNGIATHLALDVLCKEASTHLAQIGALTGGTPSSGGRAQL